MGRLMNQGNIVGYVNCPVCGRLFYMTSSDWAYRRVVRLRHEYIKTEYYCKWSCLRAREKEVLERRRQIEEEA